MAIRDSFCGWAAAWASPPEAFTALAGLGPASCRQLERYRTHWGPDPLPSLAHQLHGGRRVVLPADPAFPPALLDLERPPLRLHWSGRGWLWPLLHRRLAIAVVGTRRPSRHGEAMAEAIGAALAALDAVTVAHPAGAVPRGAQPWEMPRHTPDLLASARLMRMHLLGHLLDGNPARLKEAQLWAWSGVPFVYLRDPLPGPVGRYATIGVLGATDWVAPLWIGQPVQWCGLVYAGALHDLARVSPEASEPWGTLARGITRAGLQMTFPIDDAADRGGLLPDYWLFGSGRGDGPAINPATVQATLAEAFEATPLVTATRITRSPSDAAGHVLHLPGEVRRATSTAATTTVEVTLWPEEPCRLILTRVARLPHAVVWNGVPIEARLLPTGCLTVTVPKQAGPGRTGTLVIEW